MGDIKTIGQELLEKRKVLVQEKLLPNGNIVYAVANKNETILFNTLEGLIDYFVDGSEDGKLCTIPEDMDTDKFLRDCLLMFA